MNMEDEIPTTNVFIASNGPSRHASHSKGFGVALYPVPKRIDPFANFPRLEKQVRKFLDENASPGDTILIADSSIILTLLTSYFLTNGMPLKVIDYDNLEREHRLYIFNQAKNLWETRTPTP